MADGWDPLYVPINQVSHEHQTVSPGSCLQVEAFCHEDPLLLPVFSTKSSLWTALIHWLWIRDSQFPPWVLLLLLKEPKDTYLPICSGRCWKVYRLSVRHWRCISNGVDQMVPCVGHYPETSTGSAIKRTPPSNLALAFGGITGHWWPTFLWLLFFPWSEKLGLNVLIIFLCWSCW